jgi:hypothetical protein
VVRAQRQEGQLPGGGLPGLRRSPGLHPAGSAPLPARVLVHPGVPRALASRSDPGGHAISDQARVGRRVGRGSDVRPRPARPLGGLRRGLRRRPGDLGSVRRDRRVVSRRGAPRHPGVAAGGAGRADAPPRSGARGPSPQALGQRPRPAARAPPPGQSGQRPLGPGRGPDPPQSLAAVSGARRKQGTAGGRLRGGARNRRARQIAGPRGLGGVSAQGGRSKRGARAESVPELRARDNTAGRVSSGEWDALADRGVLCRGERGIGSGPV